ncbi:UDP-4-amino-4,6-dideoxy-N-acetyl-beta-L-altrosamine N-acetyltransferase [Campylobacter sp. W0014]|uniref:UDP-4-amino-4, 6-dideoxy-N-acetyl-beta-L-altrosamine N-acetyltransferase n=1 Tax=Campylobacter TaxID=194 RepID=UPI001EC9924C|nr:UDP-4-amino-4,6-dideoxy-N-acetyl-beta-L-altrosamine N-acetyltransferase [Campylobacter sp. W0014]
MKTLITKQRNLIFDKNEEIIEHIILANKNIILKTEKKSFMLENYINLNEEKKEKIRFYRNHPEIKKYLYNTHYISRSEHENFIQGLKENNQKQYFCINYNNEILGSVNFEEKNNSIVEFGFYSNPFSKFLGLGRILEEISIYYSFSVLQKKEMILQVFTENQKVVNLHKKFGFQINSTINFNNKEIFYMSLKYPLQQNLL